MRIDTQLTAELDSVGDQARSFRAMGFDGVFTFEGPRDVFFPLIGATMAADVDIYTNVAIAFPRSPMHTAYQAYDLQRLSEGRFALGLGTQIKPHIERRYSAVWDSPLGQMREYIQAMKAIFAAWHEGGRLDFQGDYWRHTLLPSAFNPGPLEWGPPPIWVGALGPKMTRMVAAEADGLLVHPFATERFVRERSLVGMAEGLEAAGRSRDDITFGAEAIVGVWADEAKREATLNSTRWLLAFYGSTPAYKVVLDLHGWGDLQPQLAAAIRAGEWSTMGQLIDDEVLSTIAVVGQPAEVAAQLHSRYGDYADRPAVYSPGGFDPAAAAEMISRLRELAGSSSTPG